MRYNLPISGFCLLLCIDPPQAIQLIILFCIWTGGQVVGCVLLTPLQMLDHKEMMYWDWICRSEHAYNKLDLHYNELLRHIFILD